jgi:hypothetical protein
MSLHSAPQSLRKVSETILSVALLTGLAGCGAGKGDLSGTVRLRDKLVRSGSVLVVGSDGIPRSTLIQNDGSYSIPQIPAGEVKIAVNSPAPQLMNDGPPDKYGKKHRPADNPDWFPIHERYGDFEKSGLTFTIRKGTNTFPIELE